MIPAGLPDLSERERGWRSKVNVVVEASAGTGKTTLLIQRALWLLFSQNIRMERLVGLTFGEKAAAEMAERLGGALRRVNAASSHDALPPEILAIAPQASLAHLKSVAAEALRAFERAQLSTIHAFARALLQLYPAEAGVDPAFQVDHDGVVFDRCVEEEWDRFLIEELRSAGTRGEAWRKVLERVKIGDLKELAGKLAEFRVDLRQLPSPDTQELSGPVREWLCALKDEAAGLLPHLGPRNKKPLQALQAVAEAAEAALVQGRGALSAHASGLEIAAGMSAKKDWPSAWGDEQGRRGTSLARAVRVLRSACGEHVVLQAMGLLKPFVNRVRSQMLKRGFLTYEGLLVLARDLLRDHPLVREQLKRRFEAILVDEVQDVDPLQFELILYLAETPGRCAADWREVKIESGKLFLVGDPKQSIYGFRKADLKAYQAVVKLLQDQGGEELQLSASMRSAESIIKAVNSIGPHLFNGREGPRYLPLQVNPGRQAGALTPRVTVVTFEPGPEEDREAVEAHAAGLQVQEILAAGATPSEIAVLFRKKARMGTYAEVFRTMGILVVIEEPHPFYRRQEITDLINVLRALADPADEVALAGVLRGPFGGLDDGALVKWVQGWRGLRKTASFPAMARYTEEAGFTPALVEMLEAMDGLARDLADQPGQVWVERFWETFAVEALAAASSKQGVRESVMDFKRLLGHLLEEQGLIQTLELLRRCLVAEQWALPPPVLPEPRLAGPEVKAMRFLTVHQAKGLEFPVVVIGGVGAGEKETQPTETQVWHDWSTGLVGATLHAKVSGEAVSTLEAALLTLDRKREEQEEERRIWYVALTRARDQMLIMREIRPGARRTRTFLSLIEPWLDEPGGTLEVVHSAVTRGLTGPLKPAAPPVAGLHVTWETPATLGSPLALVSPADLSERTGDRVRDGLPPGTQSADAWLGELCHRVLELWDFQWQRDRLPDQLARAEASLRAPGKFPDPLRERARSLLEHFLSSEAARRLGRSKILGREVPLLAPLDSKRSLTGRADVIMRLDGELLVGDYKLQVHPKVSDETAKAYRVAASAALGEPVKFALISLTSGTIAILP